MTQPAGSLLASAPSNSHMKRRRDPDSVNSIPVVVLRAIEAGLLEVHHRGQWSAQRIPKSRMSDPEHKAEYLVVDPNGGRHYVVTYANREQEADDGVRRLDATFRKMQYAIGAGAAEVARLAARQLVRECVFDQVACARWLVETEGGTKEQPLPVV
jgi:hypothetical protein